MQSTNNIDGQLSIFEEALQKAKSDGESCSYSGMKCNKEYRFVVADEINDSMCPHVCCRMCSELICGVRCFGANKNKSALSYKQIEKGFHDFGKGDFPYPENRSEWYDVMLLYRYSIRKVFKTIEIKACYNDFQFSMYGLPSDVPKTTGEIIAWRYLKEAEI